MNTAEPVKNAEPVILERGYLEGEKEFLDRQNDVAKRFSDQFVVDPVATEALTRRLTMLQVALNEISDVWWRVGNGQLADSIEFTRISRKLSEMVEQMRERAGSS